MPGVRTTTVGSVIPSGAAARSAFSSRQGYSPTGRTGWAEKASGRIWLTDCRFSST